MKMQAFYTARRVLPLGERTYMVGILNRTPDSFSDGGEFHSDDLAVRHFHSMVKAGATIVDVGGESTRPGFIPVPADEEIARVVPFIEKVRPHTEALISVDTSKASVADAALSAGADIVNDVWGARQDPDMAETIARHNAACILMHNRAPEEAGRGDIIETILKFWEKSVNIALQAGVRSDAILVDPGVGFGKTYEENWTILRNLERLRACGIPMLLGVSRKSMLARLLDRKNPKDRLGATLATTAAAAQAGVEFIRVHDVKENQDCARVIDFLKG